MTRPPSASLADAFATADRFFDEVVPGLRKCASASAKSTRYANWSGPARKAEAIRLHKLSKMGKRESAREYGAPWTTVRGYLDPEQPKCHPPPEFVEFLYHRAAARAFVKVA